MSTVTEYEIRSAAGVLIFTTPDKDLAMKEARAKAETFPGLRIEGVERFETRRRVWSDRSHLRLVANA